MTSIESSVTELTLSRVMVELFSHKSDSGKRFQISDLTGFKMI